MTTIRSALFLVGALLVTIVFGILVSLGGLFGYRAAGRLAQIYCQILLHWVRWTCGIRPEVSATTADGVVKILVRDFGRWRPPRGTNRGRGLVLMNALADVAIQRTEEGTEVRLSRRLADPGQPIPDDDDPVLTFPASTVEPMSLDDARETLTEYLRYGPVDAAQERYSLIDREIEETLAPLCSEYKVAVLGYSSLALGLLAGPIDPEREFKGDDQRAANPRFSPANRATLKAFFEELEPVRAKLGCSFGQMMIA